MSIGVRSTRSAVLLILAAILSLSQEAGAQLLNSQETLDLSSMAQDGALPVLAPPFTPEESRALRDGFSWQRSRLVTETDPDGNPALFHAVLYVETREQVELLEEFRIHYDLMPLFAGDRDRWAGQTGVLLHETDGEGMFVFAILPGAVYNLLREAAIEGDVLFRVIQIWPVPVDEACNRDGSLSYRYLAREGFQYRSGGEEDEEPADTPDLTGLCRGGLCEGDVLPADPEDQALEPRLFGRRFRRLIRKVVSVAKSAEDLARKGLAKLDQLFLGAVRLTVQVEVRNTDPLFGTDRMERAWGAGAGRPVELPGVQVRALQPVSISFRPRLPGFRIPGTQIRTPGITLRRIRTPAIDSLATGITDASGVARFRATRDRPADLCIRLENDAAVLTSWFWGVEICHFQPRTEKLTADTRVLAPVTDARANVLAQLTEAQAYMQDVAQFRMAKAEILVGTLASLLSSGGRAYAPCLGIPNWTDPVPTLASAIGAYGGGRAGGFVGRELSSLSNGLARLSAESLDGQAQALEAAARAVSAAAGTTAAAAAGDLLAAARRARQAALDAAAAATRAQQEAADAADLARRAGELRAQGAPGAAAAEAAARAATGDAATAAAEAQRLLEAAQQAANLEAAAADRALAAGAGTGAVAALSAAAIACHAAADLADGALRTAGVLARRTLTVQGEVVGGALGRAVGEILEVFLSADIVMPEGFTSKSRGVATHEYGHFVLCNLMYQANAVKYGTAYTEAMLDTVLGQIDGRDRSRDEDVVLNEGFADLFAGQAVGGVNYFAPVDSRYDRDQDMSYCPVTSNRCLDDDMGGLSTPIRCPDANPSCRTEPKQRTGVPDPQDSDEVFRAAVGRIATTLHDAFDGHSEGGDHPGSGAAWVDVNGELRAASVPGPGLHQPNLAGGLFEEEIALPGTALFRTMQMLFGTTDRLREVSFFAALSGVMAENAYSPGQICRLFELHRPANDCPLPPPPLPGSGCHGTICP